MLLFTDAAEHEQLRRIESAATEDDLAAFGLGEVIDALLRRGTHLLRAGLVKMVAHRALHPDGPRRVVSVLLKNHARHMRARLNNQSLGMRPRGAQQQLPHAKATSCSRPALIVPRRAALRADGNEKDTLGIGPPRVHIVEINGLHHARPQQGMLERGEQHIVSMQDGKRRADDDPKERAVAFFDCRNKKRVNEIGRRPTFKPMPALVQHRARVEDQHHPAVEPVEDAEEIAEKAVIGREILVALKLGEIAAHPARPPRLITRQIRDVVPVLVIRRDGNHRMVRRAATHARAARIENALLPAVVGMRIEILSRQWIRRAGRRVRIDKYMLRFSTRRRGRRSSLGIFLIFPLRPIVRVMPHRKHPAHLRILRSRGIVTGHAGDFARRRRWIGWRRPRALRIAPRFNDEHPLPSQRQSRRQRSPARA